MCDGGRGGGAWAKGWWLWERSIGDGKFPGIGRSVGGLGRVGAGLLQFKLRYWVDGWISQFLRRYGTRCCAVLSDGRNEGRKKRWDRCIVELL